jgi:tetratricopeptide (TPR) repeat protein
MKKHFLTLTLPLIFLACNNHAVSHADAKDSLEQWLQSLRDSIKKYPTDTLLKYNLAMALENLGRYKEAVAALDSMNFTKTDSANLKIYFNYLFKRSQLLQMAGDTASAIKTLELFVIPGELTEAGKQLAFLYAETKNPKTISICDAMNRSDASGKDPEPDYMKGVYFYNISEYDKAIQQFNSCISRDYTFLDAYMEKGRILFRQAKFIEAIEVYDLAIKVSGTFADAFYWKARCQEALGQKEDAKLNYQRAYALDNTLTEAKEAAAKLK